MKKGISILSTLFRKKEVGPDYIIIGVQKGGTTTLFHQLSQHPQIDNPSTKEIHYFDLDVDKPIGSYTDQFTNRRLNSISGEASPYYLFHPHVPGRIKKYFSRVKFIVQLRNPIDRAYSHYQMAKKNGFETYDTFEEAIQMEESRIGGLYERMVNNEDENHKEVQRFSYIMRGNYVKQIKHWFSYFNKENFLFIESEEYYTNPEAELKKIYSFLGVDCIYPKDLSNQHEGKYTSMNEVTYKKLDEYFKEINKELPLITGRSYSWL